MVQKTIEESLCCFEQQRVREKLEDIDLDDPFDNLEDLQDLHCFTNHPGFAPVCLNRHTLDTAYSVYTQTWGKYKTENVNR